MIKLLVDAQYASPYALSAHVALREKRVPFEVETVDLGAGAQGGTGFRAQWARPAVQEWVTKPRPALQQA